MNQTLKYVFRMGRNNLRCLILKEIPDSPANAYYAIITKFVEL